MSEDLFEQLERTLSAQHPDAGFAWLIERLREQKQYPLIFEARLMRQRFAMGLPLIQTGPAPLAVAELPPDQQPAYEAAVREAARETGGLFLADGDIARAWPYFRAIGDPAPVAQAIERLDATHASDAVIQIALHEGVHPRKGFELLLEQQGLCNAITFAGQYPDPASRPVFLRILLRALSSELAASLKNAIAGVEGIVPASGSIAELIAGRDWLFAEKRCYTDNSHLASIVQASLELPDRESWRLALELTEYGRRLDAACQFPGNPPFPDTYCDCGAYLSALLGQDTDTAVSHFRRKLADSAPGSAEILVGLLARLGRYSEAIEVSLQHLNGEAGSACPSAIQLCQMAGDSSRLRELARAEGDLLSFAAALLNRKAAHSPPV